MAHWHIGVSLTNKKQQIETSHRFVCLLLCMHRVFCNTFAHLTSSFSLPAVSASATLHHANPPSNALSYVSLALFGAARRVKMRMQISFPIIVVVPIRSDTHTHTRAQAQIDVRVKWNICMLAIWHAKRFSPKHNRWISVLFFVVGWLTTPCARGVLSSRRGVFAYKNEQQTFVVPC